MQRARSLSVGSVIVVSALLMGRDGASEPQRTGVTGVGINNTAGVIVTRLNFGGVFLPTLSMKYFSAEDDAYTVDLGTIVAASETTAVVFLGGLGFERTLYERGAGHFFLRVAGHGLGWTGYQEGASGVSGGAVNLGIYAGFEYIFDSGLPGLGISAEYGVNTLVAFPADADPIIAISAGGFAYGSSFENALLLGIRYYFLEDSAPPKPRPKTTDEAAFEWWLQCPEGTRMVANKGCVKVSSAAQPSAPGERRDPPAEDKLLTVEGAPGSSPGTSAPTVPREPPREVEQPCPEGMALIRGGSIRMGERKDEVPVKAFCMDRTEVRVDAYSACAARGYCTTDGLDCKGGTYESGDGSLPINCVDWGQAAAFCAAKRRRLPTELEWEWAARGGAQGRTYPWGNEAPAAQLCWSGLMERKGPCAVGSNPAGDNPEGVHDLAGNVWEWTSGAGSRDADQSVIRGGAWNSDERKPVQAAYRFVIIKSFRGAGMGFRCVSDP